MLAKDVPLTLDLCPDGPLSRLLNLLVSSELELSSGWLDEALAIEVVEAAPVEEAIDEVGDEEGNEGAGAVAAGGATCFGGELAIIIFFASISVSLLRSTLTRGSGRATASSANFLASWNFLADPPEVELFDRLMAAEVGSSFWALTCMAAAKLVVPLESLRGRVVIFISSICFFLACSTCSFFEARAAFLAEVPRFALRGVVSSLSTSSALTSGLTSALIGLTSALMAMGFSLAGVVLPFMGVALSLTGRDFSLTGRDFSFTGTDLSLTGRDLSLTGVDLSLVGVDLSLAAGVDLSLASGVALSLTGRGFSLAGVDVAIGFSVSVIGFSSFTTMGTSFAGSSLTGFELATSMDEDAGSGEVIGEVNPGVTIGCNGGDIGVKGVNGMGNIFSSVVSKFLASFFDDLRLLVPLICTLVLPEI